MARRFSSDFPDGGVAPGDLRSERQTVFKSRRLASAKLRLGHAKDALQDFGRKKHVFGLNKGQFSMIDVIETVLEKTGPADVSVWSWVVAGHEVEAVSAFLTNKQIRRFRMIIDWTGAKREMPYIAELQAKFGLDCVRVTKTHAKIATFATDDGWRVVARGSFNLNCNPRFEQFDVGDDPQVYDCVLGLEDELWEMGKPMKVNELVHDDAATLRNNAGNCAPAWMSAKGSGFFK
jgi:hypothetical protein